MFKHKVLFLKEQMIRKTEIKDQQSLLNLYLKVSENKLGIARYSDEINSEYIKDIIENSQKEGLALVLIKDRKKRIIG